MGVHWGLRFVGFWWGRHLVPPPHQFPQTLARFWSHLFYLVVRRVLHVGDHRSKGLNTRIFVCFFLGLRYKNSFYSLCLFFFELEFVNFFLERRRRCSSFLGYCYSKRYLLNWLGGLRNILWDQVINQWEVIWLQEMRPRHIYTSQSIVVCLDSIANLLQGFERGS